jgi:DNA-binding PadR family transcriptional regulator
MTNAELSILSLVAESPRYGYEIENVIDARGMRDWTEIGFSSIYFLLKKLEKASLIHSQLHQSDGRGPARKVYTITQEGHQAYLKGALKALGNPQNGSAPFLLGLSNFPALPRNQVLIALNEYVQRLEERLNQMLRRRDSQHPVQPFVEAMFDYSLTMIKAELEWVDKFKKDVEAGNV